MSNTIYLYLKTHNKTGLKYLGKTENNDPHHYQGSGIIWQRHIKKHGYDVTTEILFESNDPEIFKKVALEYSEKLNVVDSKEFANLVHEMGNGGANNLGRNFSESWKQNLSNSASKIKNDDQWKNTIGKETRLKDSIIKNDPIWREIIGKPSWEKAKQNQINTKNKQKWKKENSIECPYCHKIVDVGNYKRWHGDNCSIVKNRTKISIKNYVTCPHCNTTGKDGSAMKRWHFNKCKWKDIS